MFNFFTKKYKNEPVLQDDDLKKIKYRFENYLNNDIQELFEESIQAKNKEACNFCLENKANINITEKNQVLLNTTLFNINKSYKDCVSNNHIEIVKFYIKQDFEFQYLEDLLIDPINKKYLEMIQLLKKHEVYLRRSSNEEESYLDIALRTNDNDIIFEFINEENMITNNSLFIAVINENIEFINILLSKGVDFNKKDLDKKSILDYALQTKNTDIIKIIFEKSNLPILNDTKQKLVNKAFFDKEKDLYTCVKDNELDIIKFYIDKNFNFTATNNELLKDAINFKNLEIISLLLSSKKFNIDRKIGLSNYLELAITTKNPDIIKKFIFNKNLHTLHALSLILKLENDDILDLYLKFLDEKELFRALVLSIKKDRNDDFYTLIKRYKNINNKDDLGQTLLMHAIQHKNHELIDYLLEHDINVNTSSINQTTALHCAIDIQDIELIDKLTKKNALFNEKVFKYLQQSSNTEVIKFFINKNLNLKRKNANGKNALDYIFDSNVEFESIVETLLQKDINLNEIAFITVEKYFKNNKLSKQIDLSNEEIFNKIEFLKKKGLNLSHKNEMGTSLASYCLKLFNTPYSKIKDIEKEKKAIQEKNEQEKQKRVEAQQKRESQEKLEKQKQEKLEEIKNTCVPYILHNNSLSKEEKLYYIEKQSLQKDSNPYIIERKKTFYVLSSEARNLYDNYKQYCPDGKLDEYLSSNFDKYIVQDKDNSINRLHDSIYFIAKTIVKNNITLKAQ